MPYSRSFKRIRSSGRTTQYWASAKNAETGNHAFKDILGDRIYSKTATAQRNEILCMCIAYNLMRLVYLALDRGIEVRFDGGARALAQAEWVALECLAEAVPGRSTPAV